MLKEIVDLLRNDAVLAGLLPLDDVTGLPAVYTQWSPSSRQPYIVAQFQDSPVGQISGTVSSGTLELNCWDAGSSLSRLKSIAYRIEDLLDYSAIDTERGSTRLKLQSSGSLQEPEPDTSRWRMVIGTRTLRSAVIEARLSRPSGLTLTNINTATASQLQELPRVGGATASAIIQFRDDNGSFATIGDILAVPEVGPKTYDAIKGVITV
jgi:competence ComEA-like helix-hairpin-helix protein